MKKKWEMKKLGDVCKFDKRPNQKINLPYVGLEHIESDSGKFIGSTTSQSVKSLTFYFTHEHVLYGRLRPYLNKVLLPNFEGHCSTEIFPIKVSKELDKNFLFHWLLSDKTANKINATCTGARMPRANMNAVLEFKIPIPQLAEQQRIVAILDKAFAAIATAKGYAERNLQNSKELFQSYLHNVFANKGEGWEEKNLKEIGITQTGTTPKTSNKENYGDFIPFVKPADINISGNGEIRYNDEGLSEQGLKNGRLMSKGSVLMVCIGASIGKVGFVDRDVSCNQQINTLSVKKSFDPKFFYYALSTQHFFEQVIKNSAQATLPIINKGKWETLTVNYPKSLTEQQRIVAKLDALSEQTKKLESIYRLKIADLEELKKSILQKAFDGEL
jgi:type I restriction enzyme, S subunit